MAILDDSIVCRGEQGVRGLVPVEYITEEPYPIVDIIDGTSGVGKATNKIMGLTYACKENDDYEVSCGTHVHMSYNGIDKRNYPNFNVVMLFMDCLLSTILSCKILWVSE